MRERDWIDKIQDVFYAILTTILILAAAGIGAFLLLGRLLNVCEGC